MPEPPTEFDFSEIFAGAVRQVLPQLRRKSVALSFDCTMGDSIAIGEVTALRCSLHRVLRGGLDLIDTGYLVIDAQIRRLRTRMLVSVRVGGSGMVCRAPALEDVAARLQLSREHAHEGSRLARAAARCPLTGAAVDLSVLGSEGFLFHVQFSLQRARVDTGLPDAADAGQARAWIVEAQPLSAGVLANRLQRLGWATTSFSSIAQARRCAQSLGVGQSRPALVIACEHDPQESHDPACLLPLLPDSTRCIHAVAPGSDRLLVDSAESRIEMLQLPFSARDLDLLTEQLASDAARGSGTTRPTPLLLRHRPVLLVVDDDEVNRVIASAIGESLGCTASTARDGIEAVSACVSEPPDVVLLDLDMPGMDGLQAARRIRELQSIGATPPFPIVACTANRHEDTPAKCEQAGMDGFIPKPLARAALQAQLLRLLPDRERVLFN